MKMDENQFPSGFSLEMLSIRVCKKNIARIALSSYDMQGEVKGG